MRRLRWLMAAVTAMCAFAVYAEDFVFQDIKVHRPDNSSIFTASAITFENLSHDKTRTVELYAMPATWNYNSEAIDLHIPQFTIKPGEKRSFNITHDYYNHQLMNSFLTVDNATSPHFYFQLPDTAWTLTADMQQDGLAVWQLPISMWPDDVNILKNASSIVLPENQPIPQKLREALLDYAMIGGHLTAENNKTTRAYGFGVIPGSGIKKERLYNHNETGMIRIKTSKNNEKILNNVAIVLILFTICAGPATVIMYRKRKHLIFIAVPVVSVIFSGIIAVIAILSDGVRQQVKFATYSIIDESRNKAVIYNELNTVHPMPIRKNIYLPPKSIIQNAYLAASNASIAICNNEQPVVIENAISPRMPAAVKYIFIDEQPIKLNIISLDNDKAIVQNNMGCDISQLYVKTKNGNIVYRDTPIPAGETAELTSIYDNQIIKVIFDKRNKYLESNLLEIGDYIAVFRESFIQPPVSDKYADIEQIHIVFGLKSSPGGELWK